MIYKHESLRMPVTHGAIEVLLLQHATSKSALVKQQPVILLTRSL